MQIQEFLDDLKQPYLQKFYSICSNISDFDQQKQSPKLRKWDSQIEPEQISEGYPIQCETNNIHEENHKVEEIVQDEKKEIQEVELFLCNCQKTGCLKMYCSCFHNGRICGKQCKCEDCKNREEYKTQRMKAVDNVNKKAHRNKKIPKEKLFETNEIWGCNCSKTRCVKKYCECFIRGKKCTVECNCNHCDNGKDEDLVNEIKKQNEKPKIQKRIRKERQPLQ
ncbi:unnamed protein product [Paramecium primaurelia]|uniref:CRC domain-containing protein n=1 Tax=Paramecium primaurelia TaxID=5886 RepID=A0A8S1Q2R5_PARPR|nr:unnamed protein product [Paramecium primaurelia]